MMDSQEFKQLFMPYYRMLYRVAYSWIGNVQDAEDLLQETYLRLWQKRALLQKKPVNEAYLIIVMRNLYRDRLRQKQIECTTLFPECGPLDENRHDDRTERADEAFLMKELIDRLPQRERDIMTMFLLDEYSYDEIGKTTGLQQGNIRQIVMRTRHKLKEQFKAITKKWMN